jgi:hypothetical protein
LSAGDRWVLIKDTTKEFTAMVSMFSGSRLGAVDGWNINTSPSMGATRTHWTLICSDRSLIFVDDGLGVKETDAFTGMEVTSELRAG